MDEARDLLVTSHSATMKTQFEELEKRLMSENKEKLDQFRKEVSTDQVAGLVFTLDQAADIWLFFHEVDKAVVLG